MTPNPPLPTLHPSTLIRNIGQLVTIAQQPVAGAYGPLARFCWHESCKSSYLFILIRL